MSICPFCEPERKRVFYQGQLVFGLWDAFPVSEGHALLIVKRHVASWFDATPDERAELTSAVELASAAIRQQYRPDGFNIGVNVGEAAGQTVPHLHLHVIPRYAGDVAVPAGGVRNVIPGRGNYLQAESSSGAVAEGPKPRLVQPTISGHLVRGGDDHLAPHLLRHLDDAESADIAVAFVAETGVREIENHLVDMLDRGGAVRLITGDYMDITQPGALARLLDIGANRAGTLECRVFECKGKSFHPKSYIFRLRGESGIAYVGSSNLSKSALRGGIEWNYRVVLERDAAGFREVSRAFDALFKDERTVPLTESWIEAYRDRRRPLPTPQPVEPITDPVEPPPTPHVMQVEALAALEKTREVGNQAGLVVMATGLGKTWLAAFDTERAAAKRVLFVAHREEILSQARATFRRIRPNVHMGMYTGQEKVPSADVVFASIQTLGKLRHLHLFSADEFDYIIVDEFHHAAAATYRRLIDYFEPDFLLGLTATPERTDGGDLLSLCGENLVFRCDLMEGIRRDLLSPFDYFGVPDDVDYSNIPWRSSRFDPEALTQAVATEARARNALEQYRNRGGKRTLAFCCSTRHADFMAEFFMAEGVRAKAIHSQSETSAPRATTLEELRAGDIDVVFSVDMLNEGVDLPNVDTVMMLRPTESRILWLQQLGRGLRKADGKSHLTVIDYIGNAKVFLLKALALVEQTVADLGPGERGIARALNLLQSGDLELPPGCEVTYELEAVNILRALLRPPTGDDALREWYEDFREMHGERPRAVEAMHEGYNPGSARRGYGAWFRFVGQMGDLPSGAAEIVGSGKSGDFLDVLEKTPMTKSYKMLTLLSMVNADRFPGVIEIDELTAGFTKLAGRSAKLRADVGVPLDQPGEVRSLMERYPIDRWVGGKGTGNVSYFDYQAGRFTTKFDVPPELRTVYQELVREIVEWRLAKYLATDSLKPSADRLVCKVSHANGKPILFLPDREKTPSMPLGWTQVLVDGEPHDAKFVKIAINLMHRKDEEENVLAETMRRWFGDSAGLPGTDFHVVIERGHDGWQISPQGRTLTET